MHVKQAPIKAVDVKMNEPAMRAGVFHCQLHIATKLVPHELGMRAPRFKTVIPTDVEAGTNHQGMKSGNRRIREHFEVECAVISISEKQAERVFMSPNRITTGAAVNPQAGIDAKTGASIRHDEFGTSWPLPVRTIREQRIRIRVNAVVLAE